MDLDYVRVSADAQDLTNQRAALSHPGFFPSIE